ncbi:ATP-binding cassette domain-containing protein [Capilliphycus salinus ALCB114379]|uniref:ATP-binding cassette domain-containing protein n=1 Tax=Capilliphycus salinus TaxID=2768948 RepID=UPI0039A4D214
MQLKQQTNHHFISDIDDATLLKAENISKDFTLHHQGGVSLSVLRRMSLILKTGEGVALSGKSGSGKSTFMRSVYGNYRVNSGSIWIKHENNWLDLTQLEPHELLDVRRKTIGYVSQFLRVIPRVPALEIAGRTFARIGRKSRHRLSKN